MLDRLPLSDLRQLHGALLGAADLDDEKDRVLRDYSLYSAGLVREELDRRAGAIPSDRRRADNLRAAIASAEALLGRLLNDGREPGYVNYRATMNQAEHVRKNLETALADDGREREKLK